MLPIESPFKTYTGLDGKPLANGYVYIGTANQNPVTSPVTVYWDAAGTQPALQPLRVTNGYIYRAGTPANVYYDGDYSELVLDSRRRQVFYARTSADFSIASAVRTFIASLASSIGSSLIGFIQAGVGAVARTLQSKGREVVSLLDFMDEETKAVVASGAYTAPLRAKMLIAVTAAWDSALAEPHDLYAPIGLYELDEFSFPWRQSVVAALLDCQNVTLYCEGPGAVFSTVSAGGADVFQLNGLKNFHVKGYPTLTGTLTATGGSGSNGCSITAGFDNITLEIAPTNCQSIDKGLTSDGGKGFTIQCDGAALEVGTIKASVRAKQCIQGFGFEAGLVNFLAKKVAVDVDLIAEDCYTAVTIGAVEASGAIPAGTHTGVRVRGQSINCQKDVFLARAHGVEVDLQIITTKSEADRRLDPRGTFWFAADLIVEALRCTYAKNSFVRITGNKGDCGYKAELGGASAGLSGLSGATEACNIILDIAGTASIVDVLAINSGGNFVNDCTLDVSSATTAAIDALFGSSAYRNVISMGNKYSGSFTATLTGVTTVVTGNVVWTQVGNVVTLTFPAMIGLSNTTAATITGLPAELWPVNSQYPQMLVEDNGIVGAGRALITSAGAMVLNVLNSSSFTAAANKGLPDVTFSYQKF